MGLTHGTQRDVERAGARSGSACRGAKKAGEDGAQVEGATKPGRIEPTDWQADESEPAKHILANEPTSTTLLELVTTAKMRRRVERADQAMKSEFGSNHYEGRGWRGFHHHANLCIATYASTVLERLRHPARKEIRPDPLPESYALRGSPEAGATTRA